MSKSKRTPIDYKPQFGDAIFRPKDVVESERSVVDGEETETLVESGEEAQTHARTRARTNSRNPSRQTVTLVEDLSRTLQQKQRLASSTFRFQPHELEQLDTITSEVAQGHRLKLSKNDIVRLALNWLLADYRQNGEQSVLARVAERT